MWSAVWATHKCNGQVELIRRLVTYPTPPPERACEAPLPAPKSVSGVAWSLLHRTSSPAVPPTPTDEAKAGQLDPLPHRLRRIGRFLRRRGSSFLLPRKH